MTPVLKKQAEVDQKSLKPLLVCLNVKNVVMTCWEAVLNDGQDTWIQFSLPAITLTSQVLIIQPTAHAQV